MYKNGEKVKIISLERDDPKCLYIGLTGTIIDSHHTAPFIEFDIDSNAELHTGGGYSDGKKCWCLWNEQIEVI